jgi:hypothetical protein
MGVGRCRKVVHVRCRAWREPVAGPELLKLDICMSACEVPGCHSCTVPSPEDVNSLPPLWLQATELIGPEWPSKTFQSFEAL